jgi:dimeric dUTPase (all-alpha-NTP-PPase superfamily)
MSLSEKESWSFQDWLDAQRELQIEGFDTDPVYLYEEKVRDYWTWNLLAAHSELDELGRELRWKPWALNGGEVRNREDAIEEIVDVLHFLGNLALTLAVTGEELTTTYRRKMEINRKRQEDGYHAR